MVVSIINAVLASQAAREADAMPEEIPHAFPHVREPLEQTEKRLVALEQFPATPPAGNA